MSARQGRLSPRRLIAAGEALAAADPAFAAFIEKAGPCRLRPPVGDQYGSLVRAIVFQQLAGNAATAIHARVLALVEGGLTPAAVLALPEETLRGAGLSASKAASIRDLSARTVAGDVKLDDFDRVPDAEVVEHLVQVRGIGPWTAEMFLLFELRRPDVWPVSDLGVRHGYGLIHGASSMPSARELEPLGEPYRPYRSVAAWYCWEAVHLERAAR